MMTTTRTGVPMIATAICTAALAPAVMGDDLRPMAIPARGGDVVIDGGVAGVCETACTYEHDDGTGDQNVGFGAAGLQGSANAFTLSPDCQTVDRVVVAWGTAAADGGGYPATIAVFNDPNNDGDPSDITNADLLAMAAGVTANEGTDTFNEYVLDMAVEVDGVFFVTAVADSPGADAGAFVMRNDQTAPVGGVSYFLGGIGDALNPFNSGGTVSLTEGFAGFAGNLMVRAAGPAPDPICPTDIITEGPSAFSTDVDDLVQGVILNWGCEGCDCLGDTNDDGLVNVDDLVAVIVSWGPCPVANETCAESTLSLVGTGTVFLGEVSCESVSVDFHNVGAANDGGAFGCDASAGADVWFEATFNCEGLAVLTTDGSGFDTVLEAYDACGGELLGCDNDSGDGDLTSRLEIPVSAGQTLKIRVGGGEFGPEGVGTLNLCCAEQLPDPPANDDCSNAAPLAVGGSASEQTITAAPDPEAFPCDVTVDAPGAWYSVTGTGNTMTASLCTDTDYDSKLFVYCSPCDELACISGDDDGCGDVGGPSEVTWCSEAGREYLLFVSGWGGSTGNFTVSLTDDGVGCGTPDECVPNEDLANDECVDAIPISNGMTEYSTLAATTSAAPALPDCSTGGDGGVTSNDIWFVYTVDCPTDFGLVSISTCEDVGASATYDTDIVIYDASAGVEAACGDLENAFFGCSDDNCPIGAPAAPWHSHAEVAAANGQQLLIRVGGWSTDADRGEGVLLIDCVPADNDFCNFATTVELTAGAGGMAQVDNCGATVDDLAPICGSSAADSPGRWLKVTGTGNELTVVLCNLNNPGAEMGNFIDTRLAVYCGGDGTDPCADLDCAVEEQTDNSACPFTEETTWCSEAGRDYYILVQGTFEGGGCEGVIDVTITEGAVCDDPPCQPIPFADSVKNAIDVTGNINGDPVIGDTTNATPTQSDDDGIGDPELPEGSPTCHWEGQPTNVHNTVWYQLTMPGNGSLSASTCNTGPGDFNDSAMTLYSGVPGALVEEACSEDECGAPDYLGNFSVTGLTAGETYYIMVGNTGGWGGSTPGVFQLDITSP